MLQTLLKLKPRDVPVRVALRNSAAVVLPLAIGLATGQIAAGIGISTGALTTMFSDQPGSYRLRMRRMLLTALAAGLSAFIGGMIGGNLGLLIGAALIWGVGGGMLVAIGPAAGRVGLTSMILLIIMSGRGESTNAVAAALLIFSGGLLQMLFAIAAWPLQRFYPERQALAALCRGLASSAREVSDSSSPPPVNDALVDIEQMLHGRDRSQGPVMETFRILAHLAEQTRLELLALGDLEQTFVLDEARRTVMRLREYAARTLDAVAVALETGTSPLTASASLEGYDSARASLQSLYERIDDPATQHRATIALARAEGLAGALRALVRNADRAGSRGELRTETAQARLPAALQTRNPFAILRANLNLKSVAFRHALRCGIALAIAIAGERLTGLPHGYWIPMTVAIVLKPDFIATYRVGLLRVAGTLVGLVLTTALVHYAFGGDWERIAILALLCFGFRLLATVHYGIGVALLTGLVVILLSFYGESPHDTMLSRGLATALGSGLALIIYAIWPTWERDRLRASLARMIDMYRDYIVVLLRGDAAALGRARTAVRTARANALASIERTRSEPRPDQALVSLADAVFANANRFARAGMSLEAVMRDAPPPPERERVLAFADAAATKLTALAELLRQDSCGPIETLRGIERKLAAALARIPESDAQYAVGAAIADASDRITDSVDTLARILQRDAAPARHECAMRTAR